MSINIDFLKDSQDYSKYVKYIEFDLEHLPPITGSDLDEVQNQDNFELNHVFENSLGHHKYGVYIKGDNEQIYYLSFGER